MLVMGMVQRERQWWSRGQRESLQEKEFEKMRPDGILFTSGGLGPGNQQDFPPILTEKKAENVRTDVGRWVN